MEWKPKLSKKTNTISSQVIDSTTSPAAAHDKLSSGLKVQVTSLSDNLSQVSINANKHVVIPQHLRVPVEDKFNLTFGSFEVGINSPKDFMSEAPISLSASIPVLSTKDVPAGDKVDFTDCHSRKSQSNPASEETSSEMATNLRILNSGNHAEVGLLDRASLSHSHTPQNKHQTKSSQPAKFFCGSQLNAAGFKYKPVPTSSNIGYGNYTNPAAYSINGAASNLDDANMIKYKDSNFFVPNAQTETPEIWVQSPRDLLGMQSAPYFNIPGQLLHASFMPSHGNHAPFNSQQPYHIFHQGLYQAAQQPDVANASPSSPANPTWRWWECWDRYGHSIYKNWILPAIPTWLTQLECQLLRMKLNQW